MYPRLSVRTKRRVKALLWREVIGFGLDVHPAACGGWAEGLKSSGGALEKSVKGILVQGVLHTAHQCSEGVL